MKQIKLKTGIVTVLSMFFLLSFCSCSSGNDSMETDTPVNPKPSDVKLMNKSKIANYGKYYCPGTWNEGFEKGPDYMLRSDARWSWWRMKQSEHFFVFWEPGFGDNPNAESVPEALRVDIDDLLQKAEQFYKTNVEKLGMATVGQGKSVLDNHKMQIYLLYQTEWLATGSGYDDKIGALWVNPSTCKPVGSTIGHEIGHSFQYQVSADKLFTGEATPIDMALVKMVLAVVLIGSNVLSGSRSRIILTSVSTRMLIMLFGSRIIIATSTMSLCVTQATGSSIGLLKNMASTHTPVSGKRANIQRIRSRLICASIATIVLMHSTRICMRIVLIVLTMISRPCISIRRRLPSTILPNCIRTMAIIRWLILTAQVQQVSISSR